MVTRVWGKADSYELTFSPAFGDTWKASVPADMEDGQYAVELYCIDESGNIAYWTGMLYLNKSAQVGVRIVADAFKLWLVADTQTDLQEDMGLWMTEDRISRKKACVDFVSSRG